MTDLRRYINVIPRSNKNERSFQLNQDIFGLGSHKSGVFLERSQNSWCDTLDNRLRQISGVVEVTFDRYQILIKVADASYWTSVQPLVESEIGKAINITSSSGDL